MLKLIHTDQIWGGQKATVLRDAGDHPWIEYICWGAWPWSGWDKSYYVRLLYCHGYYSPCTHLEPVPDTIIGEESYDGCAPISTRYGEVGIGNVKPYKNYFGCTPLLRSMLQAIKGFRKFKVTDVHIAASQGVENMNPLIYAMKESGLKECSMYFDREFCRYWIQTGTFAYMRYRADRELSAWLDNYYKGQTPPSVDVIFTDAVLSQETAWAAISN